MIHHSSNEKHFKIIIEYFIGKEYSYEKSLV